MHTHTIQIERREEEPHNHWNTTYEILSGVAFCSLLGAFVFFGLAL